jgi:hypothetical protein
VITSSGDVPVRHDRAHGQAAGVQQDLVAPAPEAHARERWPQLAGVPVRYYGAFAYVDGQLPCSTTLAALRALIKAADPIGTLAVLLIP